jgi:hypothetical protein
LLSATAFVTVVVQPIWATRLLLEDVVNAACLCLVTTLALLAAAWWWLLLGVT